MRTAAFPLPRGEYTDETRPWSMQEMFNMRWQAAETIGTRSPEKLQTLPGLKPFVETADSGRVRGMHNAEGKLLSVMDDTLYRISNAGVAIPLGALPGEGRVQIDHNQISLGNEVMAVNGSAGYLWNTVTDAFGRITDPGFPGASSVRFVSGYFVVIEPQGRFAANSAPAQGLEWNTFDRWTSEVSPDPLVAMGVRGNELLLLSTTSGEFFQATPNVRQPFRTKRIDFKNVGAAGPHVSFDADGNIFWLGSDGCFYMLNGYSPARISTRMQEDAIKGRDWARAFAFRWDTVIYWTFPDGITLGWDYAQRQWHRRGSPGMRRWRPNAMARWNDRWIAGDFQAARLYDCNLEDRYWLEGSETYLTRFSLPVVSDNGNALRLTRLALRMDTGQPLTTAIGFSDQPEPPTIAGDAPGGALGDDYTFSYTLADGTPPYTVTLRSGALPTGLSLSTAGVLSGELDAMGDFTWQVRVTDVNGLWDDLDDSATVTLTPSRLITNSHFYTGTRTNLVLGDSMGWGVGTITLVASSPDGEYVAGSVVNSSAAGRFEIRKYTAEAEAYVAVANPGTYPALGPTSMAFHPSGGYLLCARTDDLAGDNDNWIVYERDGDTFTPLAMPAELMTALSRASAWDFTGDRFAISNASTGNVVGVYAFDAEGGVIGALTDGCNLGTGEQANTLTFRPEADSPYLLVRGNEWIYVLDVSADPITVAASFDVGETSAGTFWTADGDYIIDVRNTSPVSGTDYIQVYAFDSTPGSEAITLTAATVEQPPWAPTGVAITSTRDFLAIERNTVGAHYPPYVWTVSTATPPVLAKQTDTTDMGAVLDAMAWTRTAG